MVSVSRVHFVNGIRIKVYKIHVFFPHKKILYLVSSKDGAGFLTLKSLH